MTLTERIRVLELLDDIDSAYDLDAHNIRHYERRDLWTDLRVLRETETRDVASGVARHVYARLYDSYYRNHPAADGHGWVCPICADNCTSALHIARNA